MSQEDRLCEEHFQKSYARDCSGRFVLQLPFKTPTHNFSNSYNKAKNAFLWLEKRLFADRVLFDAYSQFMSEYISLGHMSLSSDQNLNSTDSYYIPHHGVFQGEKKLRVVFNASARVGTANSLNETLYVGPSLQTNVCVILARWRIFKFAYTADIEKMYRQILIHPTDRKFQKILWRFNSNDPLLIYELNTVTYGISSSAFQAIRSLNQLALDEAKLFPKAFKVILENMYVDDSLFGAVDLESAVSLSQSFSELLKAGGFPLRKWLANDPALLSHIPQDWLAKESSLKELISSEHKLLGLNWSPDSDELHFSTQISENSSSITKRKVLSLIAKLYDPMGFLAPVTIRCKIFMQLLWKENLEWDDVIPDHLKATWSHIYQDLISISIIRVPRWIGFSSGCLVEVHGFGDASKDAMAATMYTRIIYSDSCCMNLIISKTKVAPIKIQTIPRLELCAAVMLVKLVHSMSEALNLSHYPIHLWSDSKDTLAWIKSSPHLWQTFISHRIAEIQSLLPNAQWHHIDGSINPADPATKGISTKRLSNANIWWHGPDFLTENNLPYIRSSENYSDRDCPERRKVCHLVQSNRTYEWDLICKYSCLNKLLRVTAWCLRFAYSFSKFKGSPILNPKVLCAHDIRRAEIWWTRHFQIIDFPNEYYQLSKGFEISSKSPLYNLNPVYDPQTSCLRVNGRLRHANLSPDEKFPFIIHGNCNFAQLIIKDRHIKKIII